VDIGSLANILTIIVTVIAVGASVIILVRYLVRYLRRGRRPRSSEADTAKRLVTFLEHQRMLWAHRTSYDAGSSPSGTEEFASPVFAVDSVLKIRRRLTSDLEGLALRSPLAESMRAMQVSCRAFLDSVHKQTIERRTKIDEIEQNTSYNLEDQAFVSALLELRAVFRAETARISALYRIAFAPDTLYP
jgi:hypothetical protein